MSHRTIILRPAQADDSEFLFALANDPDVRGSSFSVAPIAWAAHIAWLDDQLSDANARIYVVGDGNTQIGVVRFRIVGAEATISIALEREARGRRLGTQAIDAGVRRILEETDVSVVHAYVRAENTISRKAFENAGFSPGPSVTESEIASVRLERGR